MDIPFKILKLLFGGLGVTVLRMEWRGKSDSEIFNRLSKLSPGITPTEFIQLREYAKIIAGEARKKGDDPGKPISDTSGPPAPGSFPKDKPSAQHRYDIGVGGAEFGGFFIEEQLLTFTSEKPLTLAELESRTISHYSSVVRSQIVKQGGTVPEGEEWKNLLLEIISVVRRTG